MKKILTLFLTALILLSCVSFISSEITSVTSQVRVTLLNQDPDPVQQGDTVELRFKVENLGGETTDDVEIEILPKYPFSLYTGESLINIGKLRAGQTGADSVIVIFKLKVDQQAVQGDNEIELQVKSNGKIIYSYINNEFLVKISDYTEPDLRVYIRENTILLPNSKGTITIEVANVDITDVKFLQFTLIPNEDFQLLSSSGYVYLGDIDSDDTESEDFEIFIKDTKDGKVIIPVKLEYQDSTENKFMNEYNLEFSVYSSSELSKYGLVKKSYWVYLVLVVIVGIIAWYFWKKRKNRKE